MAHYAKLDENNIVIGVIVVRNIDCLDENGNESEEIAINFLIKNGHMGRYVKTSYGTIGNVHYLHTEEGLIPSGQPAFRKNYAIIGGIYDPIRDAFIPPKPEDPNNPDRYVLDEDKCIWIDTLHKDINIGVTRL